MTALVAVHHFGLTVCDAERSARWYEEVLGFTRVGDFEAPDGARRKVFLDHPGLGVRLGLVQHRGSQPEPFDETRVGLDHLAFLVPREADLIEWVRRLTEAGVPFSPPAETNTIRGARVIVLRDPDNIQLEIVADPASALLDGTGRHG
jgi:catechol 2,3-dioxygenase-like lactoylglutathione lyase family enzyme